MSTNLSNWGSCGRRRGLIPTTLVLMLPNPSLKRAPPSRNIFHLLHFIIANFYWGDLSCKVLSRGYDVTRPPSLDGFVFFLANLPMSFPLHPSYELQLNNADVLLVVRECCYVCGLLDSHTYTLFSMQASVQQRNTLCLKE